MREIKILKRRGKLKFVLLEPFIVFRFYRQFILFAFYFSISMVCFVLRPGPPPTGLKPPLINYTSTSTTVATTPLDFLDNESPLPDSVMYDEMMAQPEPDPPPVVVVVAAAMVTTEETSPSDDATVPYDGVTGNGTPPLIYDDGGAATAAGTVQLHGKGSGSDRGKHRNTWQPANRTFKTNYTFGYNKVGTRDG